MNLGMKIAETALPSVTTCSIQLTFRAGEDTRDANAPEVTFTRDVGLARGKSASADQHVFKILRGNGTGEVKPQDFSFEMVDPHTADTIGTFSGKAFITHHSVRDQGRRLVETTKVRLNMTKYARGDGNATNPLNVLATKTK